MAVEDADGIDLAARRNERIVLASLAAVQFVSIVDFVIMMPLGPQLMRSLTIGPAEFGLVVSAYTVAAGIGGLAFASLLDRVGRRAGFLGLYAAFLVGTLLCGLAPGYRTLLAARAITGAFGGVLGGMALTIIGDVFPEERRGRATGVLMSAFALASVAGVPIGLWLGTHYGWRVPFLALVGLGCPVLVVAGLALPPLREHLSAGRPRGNVRDLVGTFTRRQHLDAFAVTIALMLGGFAVVPFISTYLVGNAGVAETELPIVYVVGGAFTLVGAPLVGRLADLYGKLRVFRVAAPASAMIMFGMTVLPNVGVAGASAAVAALMIANTSRMVAATAMITSSVEASRRGGFMSANSSIQHLSAGIGTFLAGHVVTQTAGGRMEGYEWAGIFAAAMTLISVPLAARLRIAPSSDRDVAGRSLDPAASLAAAAEATCDAGEPLVTLGCMAAADDSTINDSGCDEPAEPASFSDDRPTPVGCGERSRSATSSTG
ncbi:MAG: MFS transporter [Planctomycetota bacterium]|nr:MFS transporter [Planctomycetaceae bacterium]MDQ3329376.1 MFS transporter [Planctomycetota bacterium]